MADEHRKVEPRGAIPGTGMLNDPERIEEVQRRADRFQRDTAPLTKKKFGEVLGKSRDQRQREAEEAKEAEEGEEAQAERDAEKKRQEEERRAVRRLMGRGSVHPGHAGRRGRIAIKG